MTVRRVSVEEFKLHLVEDLEMVASGAVVLELTDHGKVVATVSPQKEDISRRTIADVMGSAPGVTFSDDYDPDAPACEPEEWDAIRD